MTLIAATVFGRQTITITDYTGRGFAPDLVNYAICLKPGEAAKLRLTDGEGRPVAYQLSPADQTAVATLSFVTGLPADKTIAYTVSTEGSGPLATSALKIETQGDELVLANGLLAVRVPSPCDKTISPPAAASTLPAPILAFRSGASGDWCGRGRILSARPVQRWRVTQTAAGPVYAEIRCEIQYAGGGYYRATVRVVDQVPVAIVTEEFDLGSVVKDEESWELNLCRGWNPDKVEWARSWGNGAVDSGKTVPLAEFEPGPIVSDGAWGKFISQVGLSRGTAMAGVAPLHRGFWRRGDLVLPIVAEENQLAVRFPMAWRSGAWGESSPFYFCTRDPDLPATYVRRMWGLVLGPPPVNIPAFAYHGAAVGPFYQARLTYGVVGLDRYKDFITDWPDGRPDYPRSLMQKEEVPQYKAALEQAPFGEALKRYYVLNGEPQLGAAT